MGWNKSKRKPHMYGILISHTLGPVGALSYRVEKDSAGDLHVNRRGVLNYSSVEGTLTAPENVFIPGNSPSMSFDFLPGTSGKIISIKTHSQRFRDQSIEAKFDVIVHDIDRICFVNEIEVNPNDPDDFSSTEQLLSLLDAINANLIKLDSIK